MGLLELDLPPIQLHASTQTDIRDASKARFLQDVGFSQIVLARELSLAQVRRIAEATTCQLEYFVHGALCVAYSGQCYISHAHTGRSANRGECSQACRLPYDLKDKDGHTIASNQHMLMLVGMLAFMIYARDHYTSGYSFGRTRTSSQRRERLSS